MIMFPKHLTMRAFAGAAALAFTLFSFPAHADTQQAKDLFKAMSDNMAAAQSISFDFDSNLEVVTKDHQILGLASSGTVSMVRPDRLHMTRVGGFANVELFFDGKMVSLYSKEDNTYAQAEFTGTIDELVAEMRTKFKKALPGAELLRADIYANAMPLIVDTKDLGSGVIRGEEADHFAFRTKDADIQLWSSQGANPHPVRLSMATNKVGSPQYTIDIRNWKSGADVERANFTFVVPKDAKMMKATDMLNYDELPEAFRIKN